LFALCGLPPANRFRISCCILRPRPQKRLGWRPPSGCPGAATFENGSQFSCRLFLSRFSDQRCPAASSRTSVLAAVSCNTREPRAWGRPPAFLAGLWNWAGALQARPPGALKRRPAAKAVGFFLKGSLGGGPRHNGHVEHRSGGALGVAAQFDCNWGETRTAAGLATASGMGEVGETGGAICRLEAFFLRSRWPRPACCAQHCVSNEAYHPANTS